MQNYFYSSVAGIALVVHLIINWRQLVDWRNVKSRHGALEFRQFLVCLLCFFVSDVLWGVIAEWRWRRALYVNTLLFFLTMAVSIYAWTRFIVVYLRLYGRLRSGLLWMGRGMLGFFIAALVANGFTDSFFTVDAQGMYAAGPLRQVSFALQVAFNAFSSGVTLLTLLRTEGLIRRRNKMVFAFGITMTAAILLQLSDPFLPLYSIGCLFGVCLLHVFVVEDERDEMHRKEILAHEYEAQLKAERATAQAKSLFFSTVSHDIRTPLNAIVGFSELLECGEPDEAERTRWISSIRASSKVLARLVDDILDLSKLASGKLEIIEETTDIPALVREVVAACEIDRKRKPLAIQVEIDEMPQVRVDPQRIRQILFNLLSNAYKYTDRGMVTIRARWEDGGTLTLSVADTGRGISRENIVRVLQPFVQLVDRNHRDGTGLGLPICQKLATLMGGELTVASEVGAGSTFTVTLRNVQAVETPCDGSKCAGQPEDAGQPGNSPARVLVVDDSSFNREVLKIMLRKCGVTDVAMAQDGREALAMLRNGPDFNLVLTDLWMPEMDGRELLCAIRADARLSRLPVYLVTADVEARNQTESDAFTDVLLKPVTLEKLQSLLSQGTPGGF